MDKFEFMNMITEIFETCESEKSIEMTAKQMIEIINNVAKLSKSYLQLGILKSNIKQF